MNTTENLAYATGEAPSWAGDPSTQDYAATQAAAEGDSRTLFERWALNTSPDQRTNWEVWQAGYNAAANVQPKGTADDHYTALAEEDARDAEREPLTDDQIEELALQQGDRDPRHGCYSFNGRGEWTYSIFKFARLVEAAHGISASGGEVQG